MLTDFEKTLLFDVSRAGKAGLERALMSKDEIRTAGKLVKSGLLRRGHVDSKQGQATFFLTDEGEAEIPDFWSRK